MGIDYYREEFGSVGGQQLQGSISYQEQIRQRRQATNAIESWSRDRQLANRWSQYERRAREENTQRIRNASERRDYWRQQRDPSAQTAQSSRSGGSGPRVGKSNATRPPTNGRVAAPPRPTIAGSTRGAGTVRPSLRLPPGSAVNIGLGGASVGLDFANRLASGQSPKNAAGAAAAGAAGQALGGIIGGLVGNAPGAAIGQFAGGWLGSQLGNWLFPWQEPIGEIPGNGLGQEIPLDPTYPGALDEAGNPLDLPVYPPDGSDPGFPPVLNPITGQPGTTWEFEWRVTHWDSRFGLQTFPLSGEWGKTTGNGPFYGAQLTDFGKTTPDGVVGYAGAAAYADMVYGITGAAPSFGALQSLRIRNLKIDGNPTPIPRLDRPSPQPIPAPVSRPRVAGRPGILPSLPSDPPKPAGVPKIPDQLGEPEPLDKSPRPGMPPLPGSPRPEPEPEYETIPGPFGGEFGDQWRETGSYTSPSGNVSQTTRVSPDGTKWTQTQIVEPKTGRETVGLPKIVGNAAGLALGAFGLATGLGALGKRYQIRQAMPFQPPTPPTPPPTVAKPKCPCNNLSNNSSNVLDDALLRKIDATTTANLAVSTNNNLGITANGQAIGVGAFPATVPGNLANPSAGSRQLDNLASMHLWQTEQLDGLLGAFPNSLTVETPNGQQVNVSQPNVSESLAEIQGMLISLMVGNSEILHTATRTLQQAGSATQQSFLANQIARANADFLGYSAVQDAKEIPLAYNPGGQPFQNLLGAGKANVRGFTNNDQQDLKSILYELLHAAAIIRAVYWRQINPQQNVGDQIDRNVSSVNGSQPNDWLEYLKRIERDFGNSEGNQSPRIVNHDDGVV